MGADPVELSLVKRPGFEGPSRTKGKANDVRGASVAGTSERRSCVHVQRRFSSVWTSMIAFMTFGDGGVRFEIA